MILAMFCREPDSAIGMSRAVSANRATMDAWNRRRGFLRLDERQRTAATTLQGPVRIIAGAGAGKTRTVTRRIAYACATGAWKPERVLAVTFSVKAAAEMRARLGQLGVGEVLDVPVRVRELPESRPRPSTQRHCISSTASGQTYARLHFRM